MANSLLDFVLALVRDPDAAARYAADPAGALAAAQLPGVTIADVDNLIPVVTDSLAATSPGFGRSAAVDPAAENVWKSGAAAAAFDAFEIGIPAAVQGTPPAGTPVVQPPGAPGPFEPTAWVDGPGWPDTPVDTPVDSPADTPVDSPADSPADTPADTPIDNPVDNPVDSPANTPTDVDPPSPAWDPSGF